ncbi:MAG: hypothetical protein OXQ96_03175 [Alphaproteobacteria bacterium]|nr:hypothetical protein [Alphaproteobacteria bacterium]
MKKFCPTLLLLVAGLMAGFVAPCWAETIVNDAEAEQAYQEAVRQYQKKLKIDPLELEKEGLFLKEKEDVQVWSEVGGDASIDREHPHYAAGMTNAETHLSDVQIMIDMEDVTLKEAIHKVVNRVGSVTGPWELKWRLAPENEYVVEERVNLIAELDFGDFISYMIDRVRNMTGIKLFISVFEGARIIVISDTYY